MKASRAPRLEKRRAKEFAAELQERAGAWIPSWSLTDGEGDFGRALLDIAARFSSEVAERLDGAGEKMRRGFLDWLAIRGRAARPSRMPIVMKLADTARDAVLADAPVRLQADADGTPVVFETKEDVRLIPGTLEVVVGVDADNDAFFLPPPGLSDLEPLESLPTRWQLKSFAASGMSRFQLDPEAGLLTDTVIESDGQQYRIVKADGDLVTIDRPLVNPLAEGAQVTKVTKFAPFDKATYNQQQHALYFGDAELLNVEAAATIEVLGASQLRDGFVWEYWGKIEGDEEEKWRALIIEPTQTPGSSSVVLTKLKGALVNREIGGKKSKWIRAFAKTVEPKSEPVRVEAFTLRLNAGACGERGQCPPTPPTESPDAEGLANTTPLVLDNVFFPLGKEPRQFDAFYLGSPEAFSKKGAEVSICFELADPTAVSLAVVRGGTFANSVLAGVGKDESLHLFEFRASDATVSRFREREPLRPPIPGDGGQVPTSTAPIGLNPKCKPVVTTVGNDFFVDVAAGSTVWTWHENAGDQDASGWKVLTSLPENLPTRRRIDDIVPLTFGTNISKVILSNRQVFVPKPNTTEWEETPTVEIISNPGPNPTPPPAVPIVALVPVWENTASSLGGLKPGTDMVGVSVDNRLFRVATDGKCKLLQIGARPVDTGTAALGNIDAMRPAVLHDGTTFLVVTLDEKREKLIAYQGDPDSSSAPVSREISLVDEAVGASIEISFINSELQFSIVCREPAGRTYIASWQPFAASNLVKDVLFRSNYPTSGSLGGPPVALTSHVVAPGTRGDLFVSNFSPAGRHELAVPAAKPDEDGVVLSATDVRFVKDDVFSVEGSPDVHKAADPLTVPQDPEVIYPVDPAIGAVGDPKRGYRRNDPPNPAFMGTIVNSTHLELAVDDDRTGEGTMLLIEDPGPGLVLRKVRSVSSAYPPVAELMTALPSNTGQAKYWAPEDVKGRVAPLVRLDPLTSGAWSASILKSARVYFDNPASPKEQRAKAFGINASGHPTEMGLSDPWTTPPNANGRYVIDATFDDWKHLLADASSNPELSWEYSTGTAWESLVLKEEGTLNLKNTGAVRFVVPDDIAPIDWAGKTNHWIRARLIGGDFGKETVKVKIEGAGTSSQEQTIIRTSEGIRPPSVLRLYISYRMCDGVLPKFVLAEDSGTVRDQSDANRTPGAIVEAFVSLATTLELLAKGVTRQADEFSDGCSPECSCAIHVAGNGDTASDSASRAPTASQVGVGRSIFIGLNATPSEGPVNVLFLVDEKKHSGFAPMAIETLIADCLEPVVAKDKTRALGETELLSIAFPVPPTRSELFGRENLTWLRLKPKTNSSGEWLPTIRGAYLNAAWASATETLTRELLGSSNGEPHLTVRVARPPVLCKTLELRVREPLGDEERDDLLTRDKDSVISAVEGLPGDWVLWNQVVDPDDESAIARVYSFDENTGEIRFGDGRHGKIPPIGRDSIVAFRYSRTEPDPTGGDKVPGNSITPRTQLNLVSPVESVERVVSADQAAGGAPPESDERVLRFGFARLRHRDRAVTATDIEDLALQSSPDIVQARAFVRRSYIRLVVVMAGKNPQPNGSLIRELRRLLLASAPASLSAPGALMIEGPVVRKLRVELDLRIDRLDFAGDVTAFVKTRIASFFDTATGGGDKDGWALGLTPSEGDIALALIDAPHLKSIEDVKLLEVSDDGTSRQWPSEIKASELAMPADDAIRIQFETVEVLV